MVKFKGDSMFRVGLRLKENLRFEIGELRDRLEFQPTLVSGPSTRGEPAWTKTSGGGNSSQRERSIAVNHFRF